MFTNYANQPICSADIHSINRHLLEGYKSDTISCFDFIFEILMVEFHTILRL